MFNPSLKFTIFSSRCKDSRYTLNAFTAVFVKLLPKYWCYQGQSLTYHQPNRSINKKTAVLDGNKLLFTLKNQSFNLIFGLGLYTRPGCTVCTSVCLCVQISLLKCKFFNGGISDTFMVTRKNTCIYHLRTTKQAIWLV